MFLPTRHQDAVFWAAIHAHFGSAVPASFVGMVACATMTDAVAVVDEAAAEAVLMPRPRPPNPYASAAGNHRQYCDRQAESPSPDEVFD